MAGNSKGSKRRFGSVRKLPSGAFQARYTGPRAGLVPTDAEGGLPVVGVDADGWLGDLLSGQAEQRLQPVAAPAGFGATLRPYQERGLAWLSFLSQVGLGACLADDMGLGKTVQLLALLASEK